MSKFNATYAEYLSEYLAIHDTYLKDIARFMSQKGRTDEEKEEYGDPDNDWESPGLVGRYADNALVAVTRQLTTLNRSFENRGLDRSLLRPALIAQDAITGSGSWYNSTC